MAALVEALKCPSCGAPINVTAFPSVSKCEYCNTFSRVTENGVTTIGPMSGYFVELKDFAARQIQSSRERQMLSSSVMEQPIKQNTDVLGAIMGVVVAIVALAVGAFVVFSII